MKKATIIVQELKAPSATIGARSGPAAAASPKRCHPAPVLRPRGSLLCANETHCTPRFTTCVSLPYRDRQIAAWIPGLFLGGFFHCFFSLPPLPPLRLPRSLFPFLYPRTKRNFKKDLNVISESNIYDGRKRVGKTTSGCENGHGKGGRNDSTAPGRVPLPGPWGCERPGGL